MQHQLLTEFFPPIESARQESTALTGSLERAGSQKAVKQPGSTHGVATREEIMTMTNASSSARGRRVKFTPQAIEKIKELVAEGLSRDEIANRLGLTVGSSPSHMLKVRIISPNGSNDKKATALGSLERAHARPRGNDERTTEPRHVSPRRREACRNSQIPQE